MGLGTWETHRRHHGCTCWLGWYLLWLLLLLLLIILCGVQRCRRKLIPITIISSSVVVLIIWSSTSGVIIHRTPHLGNMLSCTTNNTSCSNNSVSLILVYLFISFHGRWRLQRTVQLKLWMGQIIIIIVVIRICIVWLITTTDIVVVVVIISIIVWITLIRLAISTEANGHV